MQLDYHKIYNWEKGKVKMKKSEILNSKRSQVTLFIIIAIVIVAIIIIILYPRINKVFFVSQTPQQFLESCLSDSIKTNLAELSAQGGLSNPENAIYYQGDKIDYICYTNDFYKTCTMQEPFLKQNFEVQLSSSIGDKTEECISALADNLESKGYSVSRKKSSVAVELIPHNVKIIIDAPITAVKGTTESFDKFNINQKSEMYDLIMISTSVANWEARYGDADSGTYMAFYPDIKVEKKEQGDGSKIYILTSRVSGEKLQFATRSLVSPPGYIGVKTK